MEIKKMFVGIAIDNEKGNITWRVKYDYGEGFVDVQKNGNEMKTMLNKIMANMVTVKEKDI